MHHSTKRRIMLGMTTGGVLMTGLSMSTAYADTTTSATGATIDSPGIGSGNLIQIPVNAPINVCGNQIDVIGLLNTNHGDSCANNAGDAPTALGGSSDSPGIGSGNVVQIPVNAPVNVCGNQVDVIGILDSVGHNACVNHGEPGNRTPAPTGCGCPPHPAYSSANHSAPGNSIESSKGDESTPEPSGLLGNTGSRAFAEPLAASLIDSGAPLLSRLPIGSL